MTGLELFRNWRKAVEAREQVCKTVAAACDDEQAAKDALVAHVRKLLDEPRGAVRVQTPDGVLQIDGPWREDRVTCGEDVTLGEGWANETLTALDG